MSGRCGDGHHILFCAFLLDVFHICTVETYLQVWVLYGLSSIVSYYPGMAPPGVTLSEVS